MQKKFYILLLLFVTTASFATLTSCRETNKDVEDKIEDAIQDTGDALDEGVEEVEDAVDDAADEN